MPITALDEHAALVVVDLQRGVLALHTVPYPAAEVLDRSVQLAAAFRAAGRPVVLVRVVGGAPGRTETTAAPGTRPADWAVLAEELTGHPEDVVVTKHTWGAFHATDLDLQLRRRGVTQVVLAGIATSAGVESTARAAHEHGYSVALAVDAMADMDGDRHRHSVASIFPRLGETGSTADVLALLAG